jgi:hypothetical protein
MVEPFNLQYHQKKIHMATDAIHKSIIEWRCDQGGIIAYWNQKSWVWIPAFLHTTEEPQFNNGSI